MLANKTHKRLTTVNACHQNQPRKICELIRHQCCIELGLLKHKTQVAKRSSSRIQHQSSALVKKQINAETRHNLETKTIDDCVPFDKTIYLRAESNNAVCDTNMELHQLATALTGFDLRRFLAFGRVHACLDDILEVRERAAVQLGVSHLSVDGDFERCFAPFFAGDLRRWY